MEELQVYRILIANPVDSGGLGCYNQRKISQQSVAEAKYPGAGFPREVPEAAPQRAGDGENPA